MLDVLEVEPGAKVLEPEEDEDGHHGEGDQAGREKAVGERGGVHHLERHFKISVNIFFRVVCYVGNINTCQVLLPSPGHDAAVDGLQIAVGQVKSGNGNIFSKN